MIATAAALSPPATGVPAAVAAGDEPEFLTVREICVRYRLSRQAVSLMVKQKKLPALRLGPNSGAIRIRTSDWNAYLKSCNTMNEAPPEETRVRRHTPTHCTPKKKQRRGQQRQAG